MKSIIVIEFETVKMNPVYDDDDERTRTDITKQTEKALHDAVFKHIEDLTVQNDDFAINTIDHYSEQFDIHVDDVEDFSDYGEIVMKIYQVKENLNHCKCNKTNYEIDKVVREVVNK